MRFYELFNYFSENYTKSEARKIENQNTFYIENIESMPTSQAEAQHAVQKFAPPNLSPSMDAFRKGISKWQMDMLKQKQKLNSLDVYFSHVLSSIDVKSQYNLTTYHCSGYLLYQAGVFSHYIAKKMLLPEDFTSKLISAAAHSFNNIDDPKAISLRQSTFGLIAIGGVFILFCPVKIIQPFSKNILKWAFQKSLNPKTIGSCVLKETIKLKPRIIAGSCFIAGAASLTIEEIFSKKIFTENNSAQDLFNYFYLKRSNLEGLPSQNTQGEETVSLIYSLENGIKS